MHVFPNSHPPIIDRATWLLAQEIADKRKELDYRGKKQKSKPKQTKSVKKGEKNYAMVGNFDSGSNCVVYRLDFCRVCNKKSKK